MPSYYETINENILKLAYYLQGVANTPIYIYRFDTEASTTAINLVDSSTITLSSAMTNAYYELSSTNRIVPLSTTGIWSYTTKSYFIGLHLNFASLPVAGNDIIIF